MCRVEIKKGCPPKYYANLSGLPRLIGWVGSVHGPIHPADLPRARGVGSLVTGELQSLPDVEARLGGEAAGGHHFT